MFDITLECPWEPPVMYYANPSSNTCVTACTGIYYAYDGNQSCTSTCPSTPTLTYYDMVNNRCTSTCPANYYGYIGSSVSYNQTCVSCTSAII